MSGPVLVATFEPTPRAVGGSSRKAAVQTSTPTAFSLCALVLLPLGSLCCGIDVVGAQAAPASDGRLQDAGREARSGPSPQDAATDTTTTGTIIEAGVSPDAATCVARGGSCSAQSDCCAGLECHEPEEEGRCKE